MRSDLTPGRRYARADVGAVRLPGVVLAAVSRLVFGLLAGPLLVNTLARGLSVLATASRIFGVSAVLGAAYSLLRGLNDFPAASHLTQWLILAAWTSCGILLSFIGHYRVQRRKPVEV